MKITDYLAEIEYAATTTIDLIWRERERLVTAQDRLRALAAQIEDANERLTWLAQNPDLDDDHLSTFITWETRFGPAKEYDDAASEIPSLEALIVTRAFSTSAQGASLLQYAKTGMRLSNDAVFRANKKVADALSHCPPGRAIGTQPLREVVWQARNQAIHWDDGHLGDPVKICFTTLVQDISTRFQPYMTTNLAFDVVDALGWRTFKNFADDMITLA